MRHADPQRRIVVRRPIALAHRHGREVLVVKRARLEHLGRSDLDPSIRVLDFDASRIGVGHLRFLRRHPGQADGVRQAKSNR